MKLATFGVLASFAGCGHLFASAPIVIEPPACYCLATPSICADDDKPAPASGAASTTKPAVRPKDIEQLKQAVGKAKQQAESLQDLIKSQGTSGGGDAK